MKCLILVLLIVILQGSPDSPKAGNKGGSQSEQNADSRHPVTTPAPSQPASNAPNQNASGTKDQGQNNEVKITAFPDKIRIQSIKDSIDWTVLGCTIVLTIVGVIGTIVAVKTLFAIEKQAAIMDEHRKSLEQLSEAANNNAIAAKRSADAIVNVERAWIMVDLVWEPSSSLRITRIDGGEGKKTGVPVRMICRNEGRMPAWITYRAVHVEVANIPTGQTKFLPSESSENYVPIAAKGKDELPWRSFGVGQPEVGKEVFVYGVVKYRDVFGPERETWFGYLADDNGTLVRIPQREYNRHT